LPIRNEIVFIKRTIESILNQDCNHNNLEIIIVDGMSDDGTREVIKSYQKKYKYINLIDNPEIYVPSGFNRALSISCGDIIIRLDGHSMMGPNYISKCINLIKKGKAECVGGSISHVSKDIIGLAIVVAQSSIIGVGGVSFRSKNQKGKFVDTLAFGAYKRKVFELVGAYDEDLIRNQDDEFNFRMIQNGMKIWLDPSINSYYYPRSSFKKLFKQYFGYGFYKIRVFQKRGGISSWRHLVPGTFVLGLISSILFIIVYSHFSLFYILSIPYLVLISVGTVYDFNLKTDKNISIIDKLLLIILVPFTYMILHFSYGIGSIIGSIYFINNWRNNMVNDFSFNKELFKKNGT